MTPLTGSGDTRMPPPQESDPLMSVEQLLSQSLFQDAQGFRRRVPGRVRTDQVTVHIERGRYDDRPFYRGIRFVPDLDPPEQDRRRRGPGSGVDLAPRVRDGGVTDPGSFAEDL
jgi:hypothetical protein